MKMSKLSSVLVPIGVRGMKHLNREKFLRNITVPVLKVTEEKVSKIMKICKSYFLKMENFKPIQTVQDGNGSLMKYIYFNPEIITKWSDISMDDCAQLKQFGIDDNSFGSTEIQLKYDNFKSDVIFKAVLPEHEEITSGFSQIGHIIHLNLRDHLLDYRSLIGEVLVDKIKTCRTVVNKINSIDNIYRNFCMEVIAGDEDFLVTVKESHCKFQFDFSKVYWNPRLGMEHERILGVLKPGDIFFDVFCGVGPFAIPAAKRKCRVFANDLNPDSYKWLNKNAESNKVNMSLFKSYNQDGKDFICNVFKDFITDCCKGNETEQKIKIHVTMNLPAMAVEFLKYFNGLIKDDTLLNKFDCEVLVYVYCFATGDDPSIAAKQMVIENIGSDITDSILDVFQVRTVSPKKEMIRVTFKLTRDIIFGINSSEPPKKKVCVENVTKEEHQM